MMFRYTAGCNANKQYKPTATDSKNALRESHRVYKAEPDQPAAVKLRQKTQAHQPILYHHHLVFCP